MRAVYEYTVFEINRLHLLLQFDIQFLTVVLLFRLLQWCCYLGCYSGGVI